MRKSALPVAALFASVALGASACMSSSAPEAPAPPDIEVDDIELDDTGVEAPTYRAEGDTVVDLREPYVFSDGLTVEMTDYHRGISTNTATPSAEPYVGATLHLQNETGADIDTSRTRIDCRIGAEGSHTPKIMDQENNIIDEFSDTLVDGGRESRDVGCVMGGEETYLQVAVEVHDVDERVEIYFAGQVD